MDINSMLAKLNSEKQNQITSHNSIECKINSHYLADIKISLEKMVQIAPSN